MLKSVKPLHTVFFLVNGREALVNKDINYSG